MNSLVSHVLWKALSDSSWGESFGLKYFCQWARYWFLLFILLLQSEKSVMISGNSLCAKRVNHPHSCALTTGQVPSGVLMEDIVTPLLLCSPDFGWVLGKFRSWEALSDAAVSTFPTFVLLLCLCRIGSDEQCSQEREMVAHWWEKMYLMCKVCMVVQTIAIEQGCQRRAATEGREWRSPCGPQINQD